MFKLFSREVTPAGKVYALDKDQHFIKALKEETGNPYRNNARRYNAANPVN